MTCDEVAYSSGDVSKLPLTVVAFWYKTETWIGFFRKGRVVLSWEITNTLCCSLLGDN